MKSRIRQSMLQQRLNLSIEQKKAWDASLMQQLLHLEIFQQAQTIGLFHPIKNEPDLLSITNLFPNKHFLLPVVDGASMTYHTYKFQDYLAPLQKSELTILEPKQGKPFLQPLDLIIVPGLAFTISGQRLGFGKGYFDQYLKQFRPKHTLGVLYPFQLLPSIPSEEHDQAVDQILIANEDSLNQ